MVDAIQDINPLNITVHDNSYMRRERLGAYISSSFTEEFGFNIGTGTITVPANHRLAARLMQAHMDIVPVTCEWNGWEWTGHVRNYSAEGKPGREVLTVELINDLDHINNILAFANPTASLMIQGKYDRRKGHVLTVIYEYLSENLVRQDLPVYLMLPPNNDNSPTVDLMARMSNMRDLLDGVMNQHDVDIRATMWWPGKPIPTGVAAPLTAESTNGNVRALKEAALYKAFGGDHTTLWSKPGIVLEVFTPRDRPHVRFSTASGEIDSFKLSGARPGPVRVIAGGKSDVWVNEAKNLGIDIAISAGTQALNTAASAAIGTAIGTAAGPAGAAMGTALGALIGWVGNMLSDWLKEQTDDTLLAFVDRTDVARAGTMGPFHPRETFVPSNAGAFTFDTQALAARELQENQGGQSVSITMGHSVSKNLGDDETVIDNGVEKIRHGFRVGDRVLFEEHLSGVVVQDVVTAVTVEDTPDERVRISPRIGKKKNVPNPYQEMVDKLNRFGSLGRDIAVST